MNTEFSNKKIRLVALDLDGTLLSTNGTITPKTKHEIKRIVSAGVTVVICTGRPYIGLPLEAARELGISYAITANGAGIYKIPSKECIFRKDIPYEYAAQLWTKLRETTIHMDAFIDGDAYTENGNFDILKQTALTDSIIDYIRSTRIVVPDIPDFLLKNKRNLQKATIYFKKTSDTTFLHRDQTREWLENAPGVSVTCGGYYNLEFGSSDVSKAEGLKRICKHLDISLEETMACGDSENDLPLLKAAAFSVAMENASPIVKECADYITDSNDSDGVGNAIAHFIERK